MAMLPKPRYEITNGKQYNQALINRGSLTFGLMRKRLKNGNKPNSAGAVDSDDSATEILLLH